MASTSTLSFQPWAQGAAEELSLKDVLARVTLERGAFRDITEASLQEEIAGEGALELSESSSSDEEENAVADTTNGIPKTRAECFAARNEMLGAINTAEQDILMALDLVSFLQTKDQPNAAQATVSPALKNAGVPFGTMGIDIWSRMPEDKELDAQNEAVAMNVRVESLQSSADTLLGAAKRLEQNVRKETQYWNQILSVSERGWNVCRLPGQGRKLGVRYGFSESAAEFARRGTAPLNIDTDGNVLLDSGFGSRPRALRVTLRSFGKVVGTSKLPTALNDGETTLETRIRHARDSLFDEELFHEMIRESRAMAALGVQMRGSTIRTRADMKNSDATVEASFDLVPLDDSSATKTAENKQDALAQAIALASRLLLSQAHRERQRNRTEIPAPLSDRKDERPTLPILRPVLTFLLHQSALSELDGYFHCIYELLASAGVEVSGRRATLDISAAGDVTDAGSFGGLLMQRWNSEAALELQVPDAEAVTMKVRLETFVGRGAYGSTFLATTPRQQSFRLTSMDELIEFCDRTLASSLAIALSARLGSSWRLSEREALLSNEDVDDAKHMWVVVDSTKESLSLRTNKSKRAIWKGGTEGEMESEKRGIWDAATEIVE